MWKNYKISKEFALTVVAVLALWFLGPHILFSASEKKRESALKSFSDSLREREEKVAASIASLHIIDNNFLACIKSAAGERARIPPTSSGGIDDVRELKSLYCPRREILSIQGVEQLPALEFLDISHNHVEDLSPLESNPILKTLRLNSNPIQDISPLKSLDGLVDVTLPELPVMSCNEIKEIMGQIKYDIKTTRCRDNSTFGDNEASDLHSAVSEVKAERESDGLSKKEEEELLDYEFNLRRRY